MENNNGNKKDIVIKSGDKDLIEASTIFLKDIEIEFKKYIESNKALQKKEKKYSQNKDYFYVPELAIIKSPLTILNAHWGSGKTFFIENFIKLFIDKRIESKVFKKIIKIDAWKFSNSSDVNLEFIVTLSEILLKINRKKIKNKYHFFKKMLKVLTPTSIDLRFGPLGINYELPKKNEENEKQYQKLLEGIRNNEKPIIVFIDNIERLGKSSWNLLKTLIKFQEFSNYLLVLSLNINKLEANENENKEEYPIEKYININSYNLKQDYDGYFSSNFTNPNEIWALNLIFNETINLKNLSIREIEHSFFTNNVMRYKTFYKKLGVIHKTIWKTQNAILTILTEDVDKVIEYIKEKDKIITNAYNFFIKRIDDYRFKHIYQELAKGTNTIINWDNNKRVYLDFKANYSDDFKFIRKWILEGDKKIKNEMQKLTSKVEENKSLIEKQKKDILKYQKNIEKEEAKKEGYSAKYIAINNNSIHIAHSKIQKLEININQKNQEISEINSFFYNLSGFEVSDYKEKVIEKYKEINAKN